MSNVVKVAVPAIKVAYEFARKHWKAIGAALAFISKFVADHPEMPSWIRAQFDRIQKRLLKQIVKPTPEGRIAGMLEVVCDEARRAGRDFDSAPWVDRADAIQRDLRLAKLQDRAARKQTLSRLREETDKLVADLLLALTHRRTEPEGPVNAEQTD